MYVCIRSIPYSMLPLSPVTSLMSPHPPPVPPEVSRAEANDLTFPHKAQKVAIGHLSCSFEFARGRVKLNLTTTAITLPPRNSRYHRLWHATAVANTWDEQHLKFAGKARRRGLQRSLVRLLRSLRDICPAVHPPHLVWHYIANATAEVNRLHVAPNKGGHGRNRRASSTCRARTHWTDIPRV